MQGQGIGSVTQAVLPFCTLSVLTLCECLFLHGYRWLVLKVLWKKSKKWATVPIATLPSQREKLSQNALPRQRRLSCTSHWPKICHMIDLLASKESRNRCLKFLFSTRVSEIRKGEGLGRVIDEPASCLPHNFSLLVLPYAPLSLSRPSSSASPFMWLKHLSSVSQFVIHSLPILG